MRYDRGRGSLDRHATYIVSTFLAGASTVNARDECGQYRALVTPALAGYRASRLVPGAPAFRTKVRGQRSLDARDPEPATMARYQEIADAHR